MEVQNIPLSTVFLLFAGNAAVYAALTQQLTKKQAKGGLKGKKGEPARMSSVRDKRLIHEMW